MQKGIYILKMALLINQLHLPPAKKRIIEDIAIFIVTVYIRRWTRTSKLINAPLDDFTCIQDIER